MRKATCLACFCGLLLFTQSSFSQTLDVTKDVTRTLKKVKPNAIKGHIKYLADDKLKGRMPGTEGYQMAVDYVVGKYKKLGVEPAGENQTYLQRVRLRRSFTGPDATLSTKNSQGVQEKLTFGKEYTIYPHAEEPNVTVEAPLVFAGYGISAPDMGYDDYAGLDVKGKIVLIVRGTPESFPATVASYSMDMQTILRTAAAHGAVGVIVGATAPTSPLPNLQKGVYSVMGPDGKVAVSRNFFSGQIRLLASINTETLAGYMASAGLEVTKTVASLKSGTTSSTPLNTSITASYTSTYQDFDSYNVVGKITGSDPKLKEEYVVHSAHLDHVGISTPIDGDSIYNGAHDNASGVASVLEIARLYTSLKEKPKRSVLLVMVTAEEMGLLGSAYFAKYPTVPAQSMVANINTDMPTIIAPLLSVVALGANHSSLETQAANASSYLGLDVEADPEPSQNRFVRSDQYSFVVQGVPALHIKYGNKTPDGQNNLNKQVEVWRAKHYHKPQDEFNDTFDFEAGRKYVQLNFLISYQVAQNPERPNWKPGDFFGTRFSTAAGR